MQKRKIAGILTVFFILILGGYLIYKISLLNKAKYKSDWEISNLISITQPMIINRTITEDRLVFQTTGTNGNLSIGNFFSDFEMSGGENDIDIISVGFSKADFNNENIVGLTIIGPSLSMLNTFTNEIWHLNNSSETEGHKNFINQIDRLVLIERENITNDIELFRYLVKSRERSLNILSSVQTIKEVIVLNDFLSMIPKVDSITPITGDYNGYIFNDYNSNIRGAMVMINDMTYQLTFTGLDYFNDNLIRDIISTIEIVN